MTDKLRAMLEEAVLQLEYLNEKEQRGTTNAVITRARTVLAAAPQPAVADREACRAKQAEPDRGFDETPYDRGYVWGLSLIHI